MNGLVTIIQCLVRRGHWCISSRVVSPAMFYDLLASSSLMFTTIASLGVCLIKCPLSISMLCEPSLNKLQLLLEMKCKPLVVVQGKKLRLRKNEVLKGT